VGGGGGLQNAMSTARITAADRSSGAGAAVSEKSRPHHREGNTSLFATGLIDNWLIYRRCFGSDGQMIMNGE
jgi:hypothetical protein